MIYRMKDKMKEIGVKNEQKIKSEWRGENRKGVEIKSLKKNEICKD